MRLELTDALGQLRQAAETYRQRQEALSSPSLWSTLVRHARHFSRFLRWAGSAELRPVPRSSSSVPIHEGLPVGS